MFARERGRALVYSAVAIHFVCALLRRRAFLSRHARDRRSLRRRRAVAADGRLVEDRRCSAGARNGIFRRELSKRITEDFGVSIGDAWTQIRQPGSPTMAGFGDLETTFQYQLLKDGSHELAMLLGLIVDWGGTGAINSGIGTSYSVLTPTFYFGKGFGDLPDTPAGCAPSR